MSNSMYYGSCFHVDTTINILSFYKFKHSFMVVFLSNVSEVLCTCFCNVFWSSNLFPDIKLLNGRKRQKVLDQDYVVNTAEPTFAFAAKTLSGLKCEIVLIDPTFNRPGLLHLTASHKFSRVSQYLLRVTAASGGRNSNSERPSQSHNPFG